MKKSPFEKIRFIQSALDILPSFKMPEIALVGRSNVGKSSLINHLFKQKKIAKVSSTPGKTQTLNFFCVDEQFMLVDLPGYGYAKVSKDKKATWAEHLNTYLRTREELKVILILLDSRHPPTKEDFEFMEWAQLSRKTLLIVHTKSDLVKKPLNDKTEHEVHYTIKDGKCRKILIEKINKLLWA